MIDSRELQRRIDWVYSRVAVQDRLRLTHTLVWKDFLAGTSIYVAHWDVVIAIDGKTTEIRAGSLLQPNGRNAYWLLLDLRKFFGVKVDTSEWPDFAPPPPTADQNPIGDAWPRRGQHAYRAVGSGKWKTNDTWEDSTGIYQGEWRRWAFFSYYVWIKMTYEG